MWSVRVLASGVLPANIILCYLVTPTAHTLRLSHHIHKEITLVLPTCSQQGLTHSPMAAHRNFSTSTNPSVSCSPLRVGPTASNTNTSGGARSLRKVSQLPRLRRESEEGEESTGGYVHTAAMYMQHTRSNVKIIVSLLCVWS